MNFINGEFRSIRKQNGVGNTETIILEKQMAGLSRVINEQESGRLETNVQTMEMGEIKIEMGDDSMNSRSMGKSEVGNPTTTTNLGARPGRNNDLSPGSNNV